MFIPHQPHLVVHCRLFAGIAGTLQAVLHFLTVLLGVLYDNMPQDVGGVSILIIIMEFSEVLN